MWLLRAPVDGGKAQRNVVMFQMVLVAAGLMLLTVSWLSWRDGGSLAASLGLALSMAASFALVRLGHFRPAVVVVLAALLAAMAGSYWVYGLRSQTSVQVAQMLPLLIGGVLLGRRAMWVAFSVLVPAMVLGAWVDYMQARITGNLVSDVVSGLLLSMLNFLMATVVLDRLISSADKAKRRSERMAVLYRQLEREVEEKERSQAQLIQSQKLDAVGRMASGIAHDFNNFLGVIMGYVGMARTVDGFESASLDGIEDAARRATAVTRRLLGLTQDRSRRVETFDAVAAIRRAQPLLASLFRDGTKVRLSLPDAPLPVRLDPDEFELSLLNLATNARDAMTGAGQFKVSAQVVGGRVQICVIDNGSGMPPQVAMRVFDPFYTTKAEGKGSGIGLPVVQRVMMEAGGEVELDSELGKGTCVILWLPLVEAEAETSESAAA
jgi:signal transduction histidine kinase